MLRILVLHNDTPDSTSYTTILFRRAIPILEKNTQVHITWLIHGKTNLEKRGIVDEKTTILDLNDFDNAVDILKKNKPDIVFLIPGISAVDYAFYLASSFLKIKVIGGQLAGPFFSVIKRKNLIKTYFHEIFQISKSRFFIKKHIFLLRTMNSIKYSRIKLLNELLNLLKVYIRNLHPKTINSKFKCDTIFVDNNIELERLASEGYDKNILKVVGNPSYDEVIQEIHMKFLKNKIKSEKNILFVTVNLKGQGGNWSYNKQEKMIKEFLHQMSKLGDSYSTAIKIHPTGENLRWYTNIINKMGIKIPIYQKECIVEILSQYDVIISSSSSTAGMISLLMKKPLIIWNYFEVENDLFLDNKLALECTDISQINELIKRSLNNSLDDKKLNDKISEITFQNDGRSTERIVQCIFDIIKKTP